MSGLVTSHHGLKVVKRKISRKSVRPNNGHTVPILTSYYVMSNLPAHLQEDKGFVSEEEKNKQLFCANFGKTKLYRTSYRYSIKPRNTLLGSHSSSPKARLGPT